MAKQVNLVNVRVPSNLQGSELGKYLKDLAQVVDQLRLAVIDLEARVFALENP